MFDKELLDDVIASWLSGRDKLCSRFEFTKEESDKFNANTKAVEELRNEIANNDYVSKNDYLLLAADFDNYKKRALLREANYSYTTTKALIQDFLRIYDDLERVVKDIESRKSSTDKMFESYIGADKTDIGIKLVFENFEKLLQAKGCQKIECSVGDKFDVNTMEAISVRDIKDDEGYDPDDVVEIYQTGWKMNGPTGDIIIRPVKVVVGK